MKKMLFAIMMVVMMVAFTAPAMAQPVSYSTVYGTATQSDVAVVNQGSNFAVGQDTQTATFSGTYTDPANDSAQGSLTLNGKVSASIITNPPFPFGFFGNTTTARASASNDGSSIVSGVGTPSGVQTYLYGYGQAEIGTLNMIGGARDVGGVISIPANQSGAFAITSAMGNFGYMANSAGPGWIGNGSTTVVGTGTVSMIPGGYSASSNISVYSTSCPVVK